MITVIDSPCGAGKTTWAIKYMNEHLEDKFIYVTPFLNETDRILNSIKYDCVTPKYVASGENKTENLKRLIEYGHHVISTTHSLILKLTADIIKLLEDNNYILILDEELEVINVSNVKSDDIKMFSGGKFAKVDEDGRVSLNKEFSSNYMVKELCDRVEVGSLYCTTYTNSKKELCYNVFDVFPKEVFNAFKKVFIMTYMFRYQIMRRYMDIFGLEYDLKSIKDGILTEYTELGINKDRLTVLSVPNDKTMIGYDKFDLTKSWYDNPANIDNINTLHGKMRYSLSSALKAKADDIMWTCYKKHYNMLSAKGFKNSFVPCNSRATNEFSSRHYIAYMINRYMNPLVKNFIKCMYEKQGEFIDDKALREMDNNFAIVELIQFVYRSAIRNDEDVTLYMPSRRMRIQLDKFNKEFGHHDS